MSDWNLHCQVSDGEIVITLPGSAYCVSYRKSPNSSQLVRDAFTSDRSNEPISRTEFLAKAWEVANEKARELGWIV